MLTEDEAKQSGDVKEFQSEVLMTPRSSSALAAVILFVASYSAAPASAAPVSAVDARGWRADLSYMAKALTTYHKNAFHTVSKSKFDSAVNTLNERIPTLTRFQIIVGLKQVIAMIGDEHTGFGLSTGPPTFFHTLPIKVYKYSDGYFIQSAAPQYKSIVGLRITRIGRFSTDEAMARIRTLADASNDWSFYSDLTFLMRGEALHALGITDADDRATIRVAGPSGERDVTILVVAQPLNLGYDLGPPPETDWVDSRQPAGTPLYLQDQISYYWYRFTPDKTLYIHLKFVLNADHGENLAQFFNRTFTFADTHEVEKLVLDIRNNGGGNNELTPAIVQNVIMHPNLNKEGKFFVIIGRGTASAAQNLTDRLQRDTRAVFVGEPTSEWPNHYGDPQAFVLPFSHIRINISSLFWQDLDPRDHRQWTGPDVAAELSSSDYAHDVDPAMNAIAHWRDTTLAELLTPLVAQEDEQKIEAAYAAFFNDPIHKYSQEESQMENMASDLIDEGKPKVALLLLRLNVKTNPTSNMAYDGLADAYVALNQMGEARSAYSTALKIDPHDSVAAASLSRLQSGSTQ
ncbi:MAG TPA: hypothetical protein VID24_04435 [Candidatus Eremiobacteraceae bacterium]